MINWTESMQQTFEYYIVDPETWGNSKQLYTVIPGGTISRDSEKETLGSASFDCTETIGECYIRIYLVAIQNGITEKVALATVLVQTPSTKFDGMNSGTSLDAYTPLLELKEKPTPIGYTITKNTKLMGLVSQLCSENLRAPVVSISTDDVMTSDFVAYDTDNWLSFLTDAINSLGYEFMLDEMGRVLFNKRQRIESLRPVWTYDDSNSSILLPDISTSRDLYAIPNVVEVVAGGYQAKAINNDPSSPISTIVRGRTITHRVTDPQLSEEITSSSLLKYAEDLLSELSSLEYTISYTHGYCPVRVGDAVRINYSRAGYNNLIAKVVSQSISCEPGCPVTETAIYTTNLWR